MKQKSTSLLLLFVGLLTFTACKKDDDQQPANVVNLTATLDSKQAVPTTTSTATGTFTGTYDKDTKVLTYSVTYQGLTPNKGHIHMGAPGVAGGVLLGFSSVTTSPITGTATLKTEDADKILSGNTYVNLHSTTFGNGGIRGNITVK